VQQNNNLDTLVSMYALINKQAWRTDSAFGYLVHTSTNDSGKQNLTITATQTDNAGVASTIVLNITNYSGPGTFEVNPPLYSASFYWNNMRHQAKSGQIVITESSPYGMIGTFYFAADTFNILNGTFNVAQP
jgi:hypothetical protein